MKDFDKSELFYPEKLIKLCRIMKFVFVLAFVSLTSLSANVFSQDQALTLRTQNATLQELFKEIEKQSDYRFFYNDELVMAANTVSLDVKDLSIDEILAKSLANTRLKYRKMANNLIVISSTELLQSIVVSGTVADATGEPMIGVNVFVKGTSIGSITDVNGRFSLNVPDNSAILVFSFIGYATQEIKVGNQRTINITLQEDNQQLDEVVVVAYGTAKKKDLTGSLTAIDTKMVVAQSTSTVSSVLEGVAPGVQVTGIDGQPGIDMSIRVRGLGSTNEGSSNALIVIDGVPMQNANALTTINPNDIASMSVLKDAASTSLYGSRGANGVVLITTKKGADGKPKITLDARWGVNTMTNNMVDLERDPAKIYEHQWLLNYNTYRYSDGKDYYNNGYTNSAATGGDYTHEEAALFASQHLFNYTTNSATLGANNKLGNWLIYSYPGWNDENNYARTGNGTTASATMLNTYLVGTNGKLNPQAKLMYNDTFYDELLKNRLRQEYNLSASGGTEKVDYHVSMGFLQDPSYISTSSFDRYSGRAVVNAKVNDWFKTGANVSYAYRKTSGQPAHYSDQGLTASRPTGDSQFNIFTAVNGEIPIQQLYAHDKDGNYILNADGSKKVNSAAGDGESWIGPTQQCSWGNLGGDILKKLATDKNEMESHFLTSRVYADVKFLKDFTFTANVAIDAAFDNVTRYLNSETGGAASLKGNFNKQNGTVFNLNSQQLLNWNHDFGKHHVDALAAHEYNMYSYEDMRFTSTYSLIPGFAAYGNFVSVYPGDRMLASASRYQNPGGSLSKVALDSYFGQANYNFDNKYYVSTSLRTDGSSKFKNTEQRWGTFWSIGGGWRITGEKFMEDTNEWLNNLKIRANYGVTGNQNGLGNYATYQTWSVGANYNATAAGTNPSRTPSGFILSQGAAVYENLTWENVHSVDIAVEFDLLNRIHGTVDWYNKETVNSFFNNVLSDAAEAFALTTSMTMNNAKLRNRGIEVDVSVDIFQTKDFYWSLGANGTHFNTILTKMPAGQGNNDIDNKVLYGNQMVTNGRLVYLRGEGRDYYGTYMYHYAGPDPNTGVPLFQHVVNEADHAAGLFASDAIGAVINTNRSDRMTDADRVEMGDALPDWIGGFNTTLRYKDFDLSAVIAYQTGGKAYWEDGIMYYQGDFSRDHAGAISSDLIGNTWTTENRNAKFPIAMNTAGNNSVAYGINGGSNGLNGAASTDLLMFSAAYYSLKNITIGYSLPKALSNIAGIGKLRVYVSGDNVFTKSAHKGLEPRMTLTGMHGTYAYPYLRVFNAGINIEF
jgi:TonB-linked SusC/RagA family outer membrane protein